jgi:hypothetical protein
MINMAATCDEHDGSAHCIKLFLNYNNTGNAPDMYVMLVPYWFLYSCFIPRIYELHFDLL